MKSLSILGTSSDAGKSWVATAFCALLKRKGLNVAPFKAQNMSNNSFVTLEGGEIGRAQAAQAEAAGLRPIAEMNPVLLKPCGDSTSQVVFRGVPGPHVEAGKYYETIGNLWEKVAEVLDWWNSRCDVLLMEGAGSPVELNLMQRDLANLLPVAYTKGRWLLCCDIERGGVFAQGIGTVQLMPEADRARGLGLIINKFRGDLRLFKGAEAHFAKHIDIPMLGTLPMRYDLQPESEDGFSKQAVHGNPGDPGIAWIALPRVSNTSDAQPWTLDSGIRMYWTRSASDLRNASAIVIPGSKNTIEDLRWLREQGIDTIIRERAAGGVPVVGICGGYQMLGQSISDPDGIAGGAGTIEGLGLLPLNTSYAAEKCVQQVNADWHGATWQAYEIHMGRTELTEAVEPLLRTDDKPEGIRRNNVWGTYLHGLFEAPAVRRALAQAAGIENHCAPEQNWQDHKQWVFDQMADLLEEHLDLDSVYRYLDL
ncbi:cobyric acid synthase [Coraliomargarita akajimensis]|uniref:Cobyric acid synthase n=1 Tax=Coraliomargarita akajimensis (strain DSM 45221 / IAM 15411 / JCM 23193 / KCTC 12865 / 04OKA010-24) TaxID=583355 RepID=D5ELA5_CORAD|nr:cobyric acid synthase [Coraliomargarita akajimensis]ADE55041.1 cobyric acid synthase CobQ [Coraliomargarita akajimensis DSM 45221]